MNPSPKARLRAGYAVSALAVLFLLFDSIIKVADAPPVIEAMQHLGYPVHFDRALGAVELACVVLYVVPRSAVLGAVLLTGWLGGAVASHLRLADPWLSHTLFPLYVAVLIWGGLLLRDGRVATMLAEGASR